MTHVEPSPGRLPSISRVLPPLSDRTSSRYTTDPSTHARYAAPCPPPSSGPQHPVDPKGRYMSHNRALPPLRPPDAITRTPMAQRSSATPGGSSSSPIRPKNRPYDPHRPSGLYQPSRGAQRDAKYSQKLQSGNGKTPTSGSTHVPSIAQLNSQLRRPVDPLEKVRRDQQAAIAAARKAYAIEVQEKAIREEHAKKVRRIQLQVFVHARPTYCSWRGCEAILNSWALLEKHLHHAHLHPDLSHGDQVTYCLYEGPQFPDLMAHIDRRHPHSTPDDFVPGLIHHRPPSLPPATKLPALPSTTGPNRLIWMNNPVKPFQGGIGRKVKKLIWRNCIGGRLPRKDGYEDKVGASAAIKAILENARRLEAPTKSGLGLTVDTQPNNQLQEKQVELVDVVQSAKEATESAKKEMFGGSSLVVDLTEDGSSRTTSTVSSPRNNKRTRSASSFELDNASVSSEESLRGEGKSPRSKRVRVASAKLIESISTRN
nr:uncharacterized protein CI109_003588 [Kwoniella shandongensis]KAA5527935.1 hypothetical protein CI109_003588 [Kwoniella shandongensis]